MAITGEFKMQPYHQMSDEEFMKNLYYELANLSPIELLNIYGVKEIIEEQLNDTVVSQWEHPQELPFANIEETTI
jgi:hypothetical protein